MNFDDIKVLKAEDCEPQFVIEVINAAYTKAEITFEVMLEQIENDTMDYNYENTKMSIMCNMLYNLISVTEGIADLTECVTKGGVDMLKRNQELTDEDIDDMDEELLDELLEPYLDIQHTFAEYNNKQLRDILFEVAKHILTPGEIMTMYLGF